MQKRNNKVPYVRLGNSGLKVSKLILGTMHYGSQEWQPWTLDEEVATKHIKAAYDAGIQTFDTANVYSNGQCEEILGRVIKRLNLPREEIVVMTKIRQVVGKEPGTWFIEDGRDPEDFGYVNQGGLSRKHIFDAVKASLSRLQLDYVDVLQCHRFDPDTPFEETMQALHDVVQAGYARYIGMGSCWAWQFHAMQNYAITHKLTLFISMQNQYSLVYREDEQELFPTLKLFGVGSVSWSPMARGVLAKPLSEQTKRSETDRFMRFYKNVYKEDEEIIKRVEELSKKKDVSMAQISLAWVLHNPAVTAPIIGITTIEQFDDILGALQVKLSAEEMHYLQEPYRRRAVLGFK